MERISNMERQQVHKSEQLSPNMSMVIDYDEPLLKSSDILNVELFKGAKYGS